MKAQISRLPNSTIWRLLYYRPSDQGLKATSVKFPFSIGAFQFWESVEKKTIREQAAFAKLQFLEPMLLTLEEYQFYHKLKRSKCLNITKRQYGYLSGIYERQQRN